MNKSVQKYIEEFLSIIGKEIPMHPAKPGLAINENGELILSVILSGMWYTWLFDEEFEKSPSELADFILSEYRNAGLLK